MEGGLWASLANSPSVVIKKESITQHAYQPQF
jgi:hypothetical protein